MAVAGFVHILITAFVTLLCKLSVYPTLSPTRELPPEGNECVLSISVLPALSWTWGTGFRPTLFYWAFII